MIDAHSVWSHLQTLASRSSGDERTAALQEYLQQLSLPYERDAAGNFFLTLAGKSERTVVLGSSFATDTSSAQPEACLALVSGLETMRALAQRFEGAPPCTLLLAIWAAPESEQSKAAASSVAALLLRPVTAYLGMHLGFHGDAADQRQPADASLGFVTTALSEQPVSLNPRLSALCDEAVRELTGASIAVPEIADKIAATMAQNGVATALMYVGVSTNSAGGETADAERLHMLQAAEAFGRWAEATVHLVAGDDVDLWAREKRVPHSHSDPQLPY